ncbi:BatA domain-containing protein [Planctomicrobium sp. SH661]|uniref:BatA domain-containing protein n=1 Tax=Planctomicrobium sp. SH661 TaxID=3448124 RepID=UPI003F5CAFC2
MTFLNSALLFGLGLVAIPVILHFLLKQKPKKLLFPALRLLQQVQRQSVRRLRMRHFILMLLRMLALALIVLALARPSVPPANYSLNWWELGTLAALTLLGFGTYAWGRRRLQHRTPNQFQFQQQSSSLRNRITVGTLIAILLLVGWPYQRRISAEIVDPRPSTELNLPVSGVMLFDNSLSMSYLQAGEDSLNKAQAIAKAHLQSLPAGSRIAIGDIGSDRPIPFQSTINSSVSRIDGLTTVPATLPLDDRLREALKTHEDDRRRTLSDQSDQPEQDRKDRYIRRIYLFTDMAKSAWRTAGSTLLKSELEKLKHVNLYLIDVGRTDGYDQAITAVTLSGERIPIGGELVVSATAQSQGKDVAEQGIELLIESKSGETLKQGQTSVKLDANLPTEAQFPMLSGFNQRWLRGETRLIGTDPLAFDNTRYFTVEVSEPPEVLVLAPEESMATAWMTALAPHDRQSTSLNKFKPHFERIDRLKELTLSKYPTVTLINCPRLSDDGWYQLGKYVEDGGGLIVILGSTKIESVSYNRAPAQTFLPGQLDAWHPLGEWSFHVDARNHPLFAIYRRLENFGSFSMFENLIYVTRFWKVTPAQGANVLVTYTDAEHWPAILERNHGKGRTVMLTTDASLPDNPNNRWNNLPSPLVEPWLFMAFVEQLTSHVSRFSDDQHQFLSGQSPVVRVNPSSTERTFLLKTPDLKQSRHLLPANEARLVFKEISTPGHYELTDATSRDAVGAFSINVAAEESDLTRLTASDLNDRLGKDRYKIADSLEQLKDDINAADLGQEIFPLLLVLVVVFFCGEHLVANRFYENTLE